MPNGNSFASAARRRLPDLSPEQLEARAAILAWLRCSDRQVFHLAGYAGTGKTHLVTRLGRELPDVQFAAYTGKAASVLRQRGAENAVTLHSLLYGAPIVRKTGELIWRCKDGKPDARLIIADECGTIDGRLGRDLLKTGVKILWTVEAIERGPDDLLIEMQIGDEIGNRTVIVAHDDGFFCSRLELQDPEYNGLDLFDWGYCLTAHKSQGSEWPSVAVIDETGSQGFQLITPPGMPPAEFKRRWLYTATTRAKANARIMGAPR